MRERVEVEATIERAYPAYPDRSEFEVMLAPLLVSAGFRDEVMSRADYLADTGLVVSVSWRLKTTRWEPFDPGVLS